MAKDIFGYTISGSTRNFRKIDNGNLIVVGGSALKMIQNWNVSFMQNIVPVYDCGSADVWFAGSNGVGQMTVARVVGAAGTSGASDAGTLCSPKSATINMKSGCDGADAGTMVTLTGCITTAIGWSGQAQSALIQENLQVQFAHASY